MNIYKIAKNTIQEKGGVAKNADFHNNGLRNYQIAELCNKGYLERIRRGYYQLSAFQESADEIIISRLFPDGILCMDSALFFYNYSDRMPLEWTIAFPRTVSRTRLKVNRPIIKPYFIQEDLFLLGKTKQLFNTVQLSIYDKERTICDCFKYQNKIDSELFNKAVVAYTKDPQKNINNLITYAKKMRVYKKVSEIIGVLING